jgi:ankyrin repeat protein
MNNNFHLNTIMVVAIIIASISAHHAYAMDILNKPDKKGLTNLHYAATLSNNGPIIIEELIKSGASINAVNPFTGESPLHLAVQARLIENVTALLKKETKLEITETSNDCTALHYAAQADVDNPEIINALLNAGASINVFTRAGETPISLAILKKRINNLRPLLEHLSKLSAPASTASSTMTGPSNISSGTGGGCSFCATIAHDF